MIQPMGARVLVKRLSLPKHTSTLLVIPETEDEKPSQYALVIAVGKIYDITVKPGDVVLLKDYTGVPVFVKLEGPEGDLSECSIVPEDDVLAVMEGMGL